MDTKKTFIVNIEQPIILSFEIEAVDEEQAESIAREKYDNLTEEDFNKKRELGTDALYQVCDEDGEPLTEWM